MPSKKKEQLHAIYISAHCIQTNIRHAFQVVTENQQEVNRSNVHQTRSISAASRRAPAIRRMINSLSKAIVKHM